MDFIVNSLSFVLGLLMDLFFRGLTLIGYPRLWACTALYAFFTKALFLPDRIKNYKSKLLAPVIRRDLLNEDPNFFEKTKDKDLTVKRAAIKKKVYKKYKVSNGSGCLTMLIQYPFLVALFNVVRDPAAYIPSLGAFLDTDPKVNSFLGLSLSEIPLKNLTFDSFASYLMLLVPVIIVISNFLKMLPNLKSAKTISQKLKIYPIFLLIIGLLGWLSASLPIVISLYWLVGDLAYSVFDYFIHKYLPKHKNISAVLSQFEQEKFELDNEQHINDVENSFVTDEVESEIIAPDNIQSQGESYAENQQTNVS